MPSLADLPVTPDDALPAAAPAQAAPAAPAPSPGASPELPVPFNAIAAGKLPGLQIPPVHKDTGLDPIQEFVVQNLHNLHAAGLEHKDLPNDTTVVYNPQVVTPEAIEKAYHAGSLDKLVPTTEQFKKFVQSQADGPQGAAPAPGGGGGLADVAPTPVVAGSGASPEGSTPPGVNKARLSNVIPPGPGIKPNPIPNQLAKRAL